VKGCNACHSADGSRLVGPSYKGLWGSTVTVVSHGETRKAVVDAEYVRLAIREPGADLVEGYPPVMPTTDVTDEELAAIVEYLKSL